MIFSPPYPFEFRKQPAQMYVVRNDGFCWGRIVLKDGTNYDVATQRDHYERIDEEAAEAFMNKARRGVEEPISSWRLDFTEEVFDGIRSTAD
jgi:hypothetical protein